MRFVGVMLESQLRLEAFVGLKCKFQVSFDSTSVRTLLAGAVCEIWEEFFATHQ